MIPSYTTQESRVFQSNETYEIEVEVDNTRIGIGSSIERVEDLITKLRKCIKYNRVRKIVEYHYKQ